MKYLISNSFNNLTDTIKYKHTIKQLLLDPNIKTKENDKYLKGCIIETNKPQYIINKFYYKRDVYKNIIIFEFFIPITDTNILTNGGYISIAFDSFNTDIKLHPLDAIQDLEIFNKKNKIQFNILNRDDYYFTSEYCYIKITADDDVDLFSSLL